MVCNTGNAPGSRIVLNFNTLNIEGVELTPVRQSIDPRGQFMKFNPQNFMQNNLDSVAISINPNPGTIRGIHFQVEPYAEEKIVTCIQGSSFEVIVDIRPNSKSFGEVVTFELSQENSLQVFLPKGIAHGFQTLEPQTIIHYCLTSSYSPEYSYAINPLGDLGIEWPLSDVSISDRDSQGISISLAAQKYAESLRK